MKVSVAASAALFLASFGAHAQTQVTTYGLLDAGVEAMSRVAPSGGTRYSQVSGGQGGSRFGFLGKEDLGGGMKAVFQLEGGIDLDTGASSQGGRLFGREAHVGLENRFGQVVLGRLTTLFWQFDVDFDPVAPARYSGPSIDPAYVQRADNAIKVVGNAGPATISALYSTGAETPGNSRVGRLYGLSGKYKWANLQISLTYENQAGATVALQEDTVSRTGLAVSYKFSPVEVFGAYTFRRNDLGAGFNIVDQYWVGAKASLAPDVDLSTAVYGSRFRDSESHPKMVALLLRKLLSKRTNLYALAGHAINGGQANLGLTGFGTTVAGEGQTGLVLGIQHKF